MPAAADLESLLRRIAQALEARGVTVRILDECYCVGRLVEYQKLPVMEPIPNHNVCHGTGTVVPSEAECFWRLMDVALDYLPTYSVSLERTVMGIIARVGDRLSPHRSKLKKLEALARVVAAGMGVEAEAA